LISQRSRKSHRQSLLAHILLILVTLVWGTTFPLVKSALAQVSPLMFNLLRMALATLVLCAVSAPLLRGLKSADLRFGATAGIFLGLGYQLQTTGLALTTPSKSAFITGLVVVFVPLFSMIPGITPAGSSRPGAAAIAGAFIAFAGLVLLTSPPGAGAQLLTGLGLGEWLTLGCAVAFAAHLLTLARAAKHVSARRLGILQIAFATLVMLFTLPLGGRPTLHLTPIVLAALGVTAVLATAAAFTVQSWAQQHLPATHTALILTMEPVFAALTSLLFFHERFARREFLGAALILAGILFAELLPAPASLPAIPFA
jgi:drug/metabolite transporter (DMT)-like permease